MIYPYVVKTIDVHKRTKWSNEYSKLQNLRPSGLVSCIVNNDIIMIIIICDVILLFFGPSWRPANHSIPFWCRTMRRRRRCVATLRRTVLPRRCHRYCTIVRPTIVLETRTKRTWTGALSRWRWKTTIWSWRPRKECR